MLTITRRERFNAAHKLYREDWTQKQNEEVFGKCANKNWHGHNYELYITVKGEINPITGYVIDLKWLSDILQKKVSEVLDHKNLNLEVPFLKGKMCSTEVVAIEIWKIIADDVEGQGAKLHCVKLMETENNFVEYYGPNI